MRNATEAAIKKIVAPYIKEDNSIPYITEEAAQEITTKILSNYKNVFCGNSIGKTGKPIFSVSTARKVFVEIIVK
jgi:hypothetical protein